MPFDFLGNFGNGFRSAKRVISNTTGMEKQPYIARNLSPPRVVVRVQKNVNNVCSSKNILHGQALTILVLCTERELLRNNLNLVLNKSTAKGQVLRKCCHDRHCIDTTFSLCRSMLAMCVSSIKKIDGGQSTRDLMSCKIQVLYLIITYGIHLLD